MLSCQHITEKASDYFDGRMNPWQRWQFRAHLRACVYCDRFLRHLQITIGFGSVAAHQCASEAEIERVMQRIKRAAQSGQSS